MDRASRPFISAVRRALAKAAVTTDAAPMQAYMKSSMPYYGVKKPARASCSRAVIQAHPLESYEVWRDTARALFEGAKRREERSCALDLVGARIYKAHRERWESFELYETFIVVGAWWDLVDETAIQHLGRLMQVHAEPCTAQMRRWSYDDCMWRRRSAIICQIKSKERTDESLLFESIEASMASSEFFLRKGIGWALREYAKTKPQAVIRFVRRNEAKLSPLSKREALRRLAAEGLV